jgi:Flp pilus assembly pilin Flp
MEAMRRLKDRKGQNTVEYMMMLAMVVGVALIAGAAVKKFMPGLFGQISTTIATAAQSLSAGG